MERALLKMITGFLLPAFSFSLPRDIFGLGKAARVRYSFTGDSFVFVLEGTLLQRIASVNKEASITDASVKRANPNGDAKETC